jgi:hypothetical protein
MLLQEREQKATKKPETIWERKQKNSVDHRHQQKQKEEQTKNTQVSLKNTKQKRKTPKLTYL